MDKTVACLLGALGTIAAVAPSNAAPVQPVPETLLQAQSYGDLLRPVPNATAVLAALDAAPQAATSGDADVTQVQYYERRDHHHHHQQRRYIRRRPRYHHHHHHHHHNSVVIHY